MKIILDSPYRLYFLVSLFFVFLASWFSVGWHHPDEHFQIIEAAQYKLGKIDYSSLPWEFHEKIRPSLQPAITFWFLKLFNGIGFSNPFHQMFLFRLLVGIMNWFLVIRLSVTLLPSFKNDQMKKWFLLSSLFLFFIPYINVRYTSESLSTIFIFLSIILLQKQNYKDSDFFLLGVFFMTSFYFRFQMAFAVIGIILWLLFVKRIKINSFFLMLLGVIIMGMVCLKVDEWFYGEWLFTPWRYFKINILQHKADEFGIEPWWYYFSEFFRTCHVFAFILILGFIFFIKSKKKSMFFWLIITFLLGHFMVGHKELRFIFPMWYPFLYLSMLGFDYMAINLPKWNSYFLKSLAILIPVNCLLFLLFTFNPANESIYYYEYIYQQSVKNNNKELFCYENSIYKENVLFVQFYKPSDLKVTIFNNKKELDSLLEINKSVYVLSHNIFFPFNSDPYRVEKVYALYPDWIFHFNINNWLSRTDLKTIFKVEKK